MRIRAAAALLFGLTLAWTTSLAAQTPEPLDQLLEDWQAAFNAGEFAKVAALYTSDARRAPPDSPELISGQDEILAAMAPFAGITIKLTSAGGMLGEEYGSTWGNFELWEGDQMVNKGRWMNAVKMTDGGWKIHRDIWNSSIPEEDYLYSWTGRGR
jgi:ketosteroid isomerase-like protein